MGRAAVLHAGVFPVFSTLAAGARPRDGCGVKRPAQLFYALRLAAVLCAAAGVARAVEPWPVRGGVSGEVRIAALEELGLTWSVASDAAGLRLAAVRPGVDVRIAVSPGEDGAWRWELRQGELDLAELWPLLRARLGSGAEGWSASGRATLRGAGQWSAHAGLSGELKLALRDGWARSEALQAEVAGIELDLRAPDLVAGVLPPGQQLRAARITVGGVALSDVRAEFGLASGRRLEVAGLEAKVLGGTVRMRPFGIVLAEPVVAATAEVGDLSLAEVARLLPWAVASAEGRLKGRVSLVWDSTHGLSVSAGGLSIVRADAAEFRLAPSPGFLTGGMPRRLAFLPRSWGRWTETAGPANPAYAPLRAIELGEVGLRVETLEVDFRPDGIADGRTATVRILARPTRADLVEEVSLQVNFYGPLADALALGLNDQVRLRWR